MKRTIVRTASFFLKGMVTAIFAHGAAFMALASAKSVWHFLGHTVGTMSIQLLIGR